MVRINNSHYLCEYHVLNHSTRRHITCLSFITITTLALNQVSDYNSMNSRIYSKFILDSTSITSIVIWTYTYAPINSNSSLFFFGKIFCSRLVYHIHCLSNLVHISRITLKHDFFLKQSKK